MKYYYKTIKNHKTEYWCGDSQRASVLLIMGYTVIPLGVRKPKNVSRETFKVF